MRSFFAIPVPEEVRTYLHGLTAPLKQSRDRISWVAQRNIHMTLSFLGDTEESALDAHETGLIQLADRIPAFELVTQDTGVFPHANDPRVLWIGAGLFDQSLKKMKQGLDNFLRKQGYAIDNRPYHPHITLGRVKNLSRNSQSIHEYLSMDVREIVFPVNELLWIKSTLTPMGAEYEVMRTFKLNTGGNP